MTPQITSKLFNKMPIRHQFITIEISANIHIGTDDLDSMREMKRNLLIAVEQIDALLYAAEQGA